MDSLDDKVEVAPMAPKKRVTYKKQKRALVDESHMFAKIKEHTPVLINDNLLEWWDKGKILQIVSRVYKNRRMKLSGNFPAFVDSQFRVHYKVFEVFAFHADLIAMSLRDD